MSDPSSYQNSDSIIQDFFYSVKDLRDFVFASKKRALDEANIKILLKKRIASIKTNYNTLTRNMNIEPEARSNVLFESISKLTDVINSMDFSNFELIWFEINALINSFASALISLHAQGDIWSIQGSATLLVQIILGLPQIDHLPSLLGTASIEDPEYLDRWKVTFNCLQFSAETYNGVIYAVKIAGLKDFTHWVNQSYYYLSLLDHYFTIFDFENIAQVLRKDPGYYFKMVYILCSSLQIFIELSLLLIKKLGSKWPVDISTSGLFEDRSLAGFLHLINHVKENTKVAVDKVNEVFKSGIWSLNDNPLQADYFKSMLQFNKLYAYYASYINSLKVVEPESHKLSSKSPNDAVIRSLTESVSLNDWVLSYYDQQAGSHENILNSHFASAYIDIVHQRFELVALLAISTDDTNLLENYFENLNWLISNEKTIQVGSLVFKKFLVELFIATRLGKKDLIQNLFSELGTIQDSIVNQSRDFTASVLLENILGYLVGEKGIPTKDEVLVKINKNGIIASGDIHLVSEFQDYVDYLLQTLKGEKFDLSEKLLVRKSFFNISDSLTWLIPDFNVIFKEKLTIPLFYLPFNRSCDGIIDFTPS